MTECEHFDRFAVARDAMGWGNCAVERRAICTSGRAAKTQECLHYWRARAERAERELAEVLALNQAKLVHITRALFALCQGEYWIAHEVLLNRGPEKWAGKPLTLADAGDCPRCLRMAEYVERVRSEDAAALAQEGTE